MINNVNANEAKIILDKIESSERIIILPREKNIEFMSKYNFSEEEVIEIIKGLTINDYKYRYIKDDPEIDAEYLYVFNQIMTVPSYDGFEDLLNIFIKVCYLNKNDKTIVVVSFHD